MADPSWRDLEGSWQRLQWARRRRGFDSAEAAAESLGMKGGTYRAYERPPTASKSITLDHQMAARIAKKFRVSWQWLLLGDGSPDEVENSTDPALTVVEAMRGLPRDRQEAVAAAVVALIKTGTGN